ncbi:MAG: chloride channel protein [Thermoanaerobaculia bacterium]
MSLSRSDIAHALRKFLRRMEFFVARRFALSTREDRIFFALVPTIGLVAGALAVIVQRLSEWLRVLLWGYTPSYEFAVRTGISGWRVLLALVTGGVLVAILQRLAKAPLATHGVSSLVEAVALHGGRLAVKPVLYSAAASIATVGAGGSLGREGPMLRLGAAVSSWLGQRLGLPSRRLKILLGCGTAAGFAAAYNVPIGGSLFAMEVILGSFALEIFGPIVVAAVLATMLARAAESSAPIYPLAGYALASPWEIGFHFGLGLVGAVSAVAFVLGVRVVARMFRAVAVVPEGLLPIVGLALLAGLGFFWPEVLGNGFSTITSALREGYTLKMLALLAALKLVATALTAGSGCPGGHFTPSLCFGALVGGAYGDLVHTAFPHATASSGSYVAVGMAAVAAGSSHAPLSAILILFELTGNYDLILPLMIASIVSSMTAKRLYPYSIYTEPLQRRGVELSWRMEEAALAGLRVEAMLRDDLETLLPNASYAEVVDKFLGTKRQRLFVVDSAKKLLGFISLHDIKHALRETESLSVVLAHDLMSPVTTTLEISDRLHRAAEDFARSDFERLPVLAADGTFAGVLAKRDLLAVYAQEVLGRPAVLSTFAASDQPGARGNAVELPPDFSLRSIPVTAELDGRTLAECAMPQRYAVRVIEIHRPAPGGPEWIVPDAATILAFGDELVILGPTQRVDALAAGRFDEAQAMGSLTEGGSAPARA